MEITCPFFKNGEPIPEKYTCLGENINPPLDFIDVPKTAQSLVLIIEDIDATPKPWTHWLIFNILPSEKGIQEGRIPKFAMEGLSNNHTFGYEGPCPKYFKGTHHYLFRLIALNTRFYISGEVEREELEVFMDGHIIEEAVLMGTCTSKKLEMVS